MARYIDAEELELEYYGLSIHGTMAVKNVLPIFTDLLEKQPTADVEEVRHGEWIEEYRGLCPREKVIICSLCGRMEERKEPYCHCGAKMDGGKENDL